MASESSSSPAWFDNAWWRIPVFVAALLAIGIGIALVSPARGEPSAARLEMAGDRTTLDAIFAGDGPLLQGSSNPPAKCSKASTNADQSKLSFSTSHTTKGASGTTSSKLDASVTTETSKTPSKSDACTETSQPKPPVRPSAMSCGSHPTRHEPVCLARRAVNRDWGFIGLYAFAGFILCFVGGKRARTRPVRTLLYGGALAAICAALADCVENVGLIHALDYPSAGNWPRLMTIAATVKWALVPVFVSASVLGAITVVRKHRPPRTVDIPKLDREARYTVRGLDEADHGKIGVSFSGGGIRSASFCLGVMQRLQEPAADDKRSLMSRVRFLSAVSGGGYLAGAAQMYESLQATKGQPFTRGSAEQDHLRRHGNYLADGAGQWANAIAQLVGKLLANLVLIALAVVVLAQPLGWIGRFFLGAKRASVDPHVGSWPTIPMYVWVGLAITAIPALGLAVGHKDQATKSVATSFGQRRSGFAVSLSIALGGAAILLVLTAVVLPLLNSLGHWIAGLVGHPTGAVAAAWPTALITALLGRVNIKALGRETSGGGAPADPTAAKPKKSGPLQYFEKGLLELVAGPAIAVALFAYLTAFAAQARSGGVRGAFVRLGHHAVTSWEVLIVGGVAVVLALFGIDAVSWSMHRFYKRRLWSAFTYDGKGNELPWSTATTLSKLGDRIVGRPELVLCGAAQVSGPEVAPPGHRAVSWTFTSKAIGGPEIGWCNTEDMETALTAHHRGGDVSMFGAIAICGAAFGSAMGRQSYGTLNSVFAITNARLGVWLPNPNDIDAASGGGSKWEYRRHPLTYWVREIFGRYSPKARWILVADGGHYENLGVVELLRRRCLHIVSIDASGDASGALTTVAQAIRLAQEELGVEFTLPSHEEPPKAAADTSGAANGTPHDTVETHVTVETHETIETPGSVEMHDTITTRETTATHEAPPEGKASDQPAKAKAAANEWDNAPGGGTLDHIPKAIADKVADRVAKNAVTTITFRYPPELGITEAGTLVIGRAVLDPTTPLDVVSYAAGNGSFPNDSTGDQWFDADQFDDYRILGYHLGGQINALTADW